MALTRKRIIYDNAGHEYLVRYHLLFKEKESNNETSPEVPFNLFYHKILVSDERVFHDHPWNYATLILSGGYYEHTPEGTFWRGAGSFRRSKAEDLHWLELKKNTPCHTLFFHGPRKRTWGFMTENGWTDYRTYLNSRTV